jgi:hypothetical protein
MDRSRHDLARLEDFEIDVCMTFDVEPTKATKAVASKFSLDADFPSIISFATRPLPYRGLYLIP